MNLRPLLAGLAILLAFWAVFTQPNPRRPSEVDPGALPSAPGSAPVSPGSPGRTTPARVSSTADPGPPAEWMRERNRQAKARAPQQDAEASVSSNAVPSKPGAETVSAVSSPLDLGPVELTPGEPQLIRLRPDLEVTLGGTLTTNGEVALSFRFHRTENGTEIVSEQGVQVTPGRRVAIRVGGEELVLTPTIRPP